MKKHFLLLLFGLFAFISANSKLYIATRDVKVRTGRGLNHTVLGIIRKDSTVDVTAINGSWAKIEYKDRNAYVPFKSFREVSEEAVKKAMAVDDSIFSTNNILIGIGGLIGLIIIYKVVKSLLNRNGKASDYSTDNLDKPVYWHQCKHCKAVVRKEKSPNVKGCYKAAEHNWTQLAEVGYNKYMCKNCSTMIEVKTEPVTDGCPEADLHEWAKI